MRKKQIFNNVMKGFAVGTLVLSLGGGLAFASSASTTTSISKSAVTRGFKDPEARKKALQNELNALVKDGKLSQEKANKIIAYLEKKAAERKTEHDKIEKMTEEQRQAYFEQRKAQKVDLYSELVNQKIITEKESSVLKEALPHLSMKKGHLRGKRDPEERKQALTSLLSTLVKDKKISQDTADKVIAFFNKKAEQRQAEHEKIKNMTESERKKYFETKKDPFTEMVEQKILTQNEAKVLQEAFPKHKK